MQISGTGKSNRSSVAFEVAMQQSGTGKLNRGPVVIVVAVQHLGTGRLSRRSVVIAVAQKLFGTRSSSFMQVVMVIALKIRKLISTMYSKSRYSALPRDISHPKRVSFICVITLPPLRGLFSPDANDYRLQPGNPVSHAPLVNATRTLPNYANAYVRDLFTGF